MLFLSDVFQLLFGRMRAISSIFALAFMKKWLEFLWKTGKGRCRCHRRFKKKKEKKNGQDNSTADARSGATCKVSHDIEIFFLRIIHS